ncbi:MAG: hypothetical protein WKG00_25935 [Polyangiaceae bacterium]
MAPELWRGEPASARSDVFAVGALLYELCAGRAPLDDGRGGGVLPQGPTADLPLGREARRRPGRVPQELSAAATAGTDSAR